MKPYVLQRELMKDSKGQFLTRALFKELSTTPHIPCIFTLNDEDDEENGLYSFRKLYISFNDPTEYDQAINILGSIDHWEALSSTDTFAPHLRSMRKQLALKMESEAFKQILNEGLTADKAAVRLTAYKSILKEVQDISEETNKRKDEVKPKNKGAGRPSRKEVERKLEEEAKELKRLKEDQERLTIN